MKKYIILLLCISNPLLSNMSTSIGGAERNALMQSFEKKSAETVFTDIYRTNYWNGWESVSGQGSNVSTTRGIRVVLPELIKKLGIKTMLDAPCGDFNWMHALIDELDLDLYIGLDIVKSMIYDCQQKYGTSKRVFMFADLITTPLPKVDLIFSRDCLAHLSYKDAYQVLKNFKESGSKYLLISHHLSPNIKKNLNIVSGLHYPIKLTITPFNFREPLFVIRETAEHASAPQEKSLALWRLEDIDLDAICI